jgi:glyoxylase-like metal-dependent hydrolase (beta-lactamase superfamily II)
VLERLTERIVYMPADAATDRPLLAAILGNDKVLMIDAGNTPAHVALFADRLRAETGRGPDQVVLTHWHWDHTFGLSALAAQSVAQAETAGYLARLQGLAWDDEALARRVAAGEEIAFCAEHIAKAFGAARDIRVVLPTTYFEDALTLDLGGVTCELRHIPTDHSSDGTGVYVREERVLFLGDALGPAVYAPREYYSATTVRRLMDFVGRFPAEWFAESHSDPAKRDAFWRRNRILDVVSRLILDGVTRREYLIGEIRRRLGVEIPEDYAEVVDLFLNCPATGDPERQYERMCRNVNTPISKTESTGHGAIP